MVCDMEASAYINGAALPGVRAAVPALAEWYLWVLLTPVVLRLGRRWPIGATRPWRTWAVHGAAVVVTSLLRGIVYGVATVFVARSAPDIPLNAFFVRLVVGFLPTAAVLYGGILSYGVATAYARRHRESEVRNAQRESRLEAQLARAELAALRANLNPHFLFNALHSVGALVRSGERTAAVDVVSELSELLRHLLRRNAPEEVTLAAELAFTRRYLAIEQVRFSDRLRVTWSVEPGTERALVPRLLLQPLVENAIRHGVTRATAAGAISIGSARRGDMLEIRVIDDGPGPALPVPPQAVASERGGGYGLDAARARLRLAYGDRADVVLAAGAGGGALVTVVLPYRAALVDTPGGAPVAVADGGAAVESDVAESVASGR